jgi:hypothetical protein
VKISKVAIQALRIFRRLSEAPQNKKLKGTVMNTISVWRATAPQAAFPTLQEEIATDVVSVGGGITGVTLALNLAEQGTSAVLLEARDLGFGSTGNSTGNLYETISRGIHRIVDRWGEDVAHAVTTARRSAVEQIERRVQKYDIACGFRRCLLYRYATSDQAQERIEKEYQGSLKAGLTVRLENRNGIIQEELNFSLEPGGHANPLRTQIFRVCLFDEQTMVDRNLNVFDCGSLADVRHELMQFGFVEGVVVLQPHLGEQVVIVQIVEKLVAQNVHPVLIRTVDQLNKLATPRVRVPLR